jgi:hypothetical protein
MLIIGVSYSSSFMAEQVAEYAWIVKQQFFCAKGGGCIITLTNIL